MNARPVRELLPHLVTEVRLRVPLLISNAALAPLSPPASHLRFQHHQLPIPGIPFQADGEEDDPAA